MKKLFILSFLFIIARALFAQNYYDSPGGRGIRLAVAAPAGKDLAAAETWLPRYAQGMFTGNFNKFSAMTIIALQDRSSVEAEQELSISGDFSDEDYIRIGNMTNAQFVLAGSIQDISGGRFSVQWSITELETGVARGAFSKICSFTELRNAFKVINDLLSGLETTKNRTLWDFNGWPLINGSKFPEPEAVMFGGSRSFRFEVAAALVDAQGRTMGTDTVYLTSSAMGFNAGDKRLNPPPASIAQPVFRRAGIKDYTPPLTVRITSVNGISVESPNENGFMRVLTKAEHSAAISAK